MRLFALHVPLVALLLTSVQAQNFAVSPGYNAPPLENANLAFYTILLLATFIQIICAVSYLFRGRSPHLLPGIVAIVAFLFLEFSWALGIVTTVANWTYDQDFELVIHGQALLDIYIATGLFFDWVDPAIITVVALVLRDRYRTYTQHATPSSNSQTRFPFTLTTWLLIAVLFTTSSASTGIYGVAYNTYDKGILASDDSIHDGQQIDHLQAQLRAQLKLSNRFDYAFVAFVVITTAFLLAYAVMVKKQAKGDKIASITLFSIIPLLSLRAFARLIFEVVNARLPRSSTWTANDAYAIDLASTIVYGVLHFLVACVLLHFFMNLRLWNGPGEHTQYGGYPPQQFYPQGSMQPLAQFPGQWGQPQGYPLANVLHQGINPTYAYPPGMPYYPNQQMHMTALSSTPDTEKLPEGELHSHANQSPPPTS